LPDSGGLRQRAAWYREFAERAGNPWVWAARLKTAEERESDAAGSKLNPLSNKCLVVDAPGFAQAATAAGRTSRGWLAGALLSPVSIIWRNIMRPRDRRERTVPIGMPTSLDTPS
jgi:hypothetical protein